VLDTLGWHWAFWINVPIGIAGALLGWFVLPQSDRLPRGEHFDWRGALLIAPALTGFIAVLNEFHTLGPTSPILLGCLAVGIASAILFVLAERRSPSPLLDLQLLTKPAFLLGNLANFASYAVLFGVFFLVPFALVRLYGDSALAAGLRLSILPVMLGLIAPAGGMLYDRLGPRVPTCVGMLICIAGLALLYLFLDGNAAHVWLVTVSLAVIGVGQGLFISPNSSAIMSAAPESETGQAGSVLNVVRFLGVSTGIAGASTVLALSLGGSSGSTLSLPVATLVAASRDVIILIVCCAAAAGLISLIRPRGGRKT
jgi:MFS family permease